MSTTPHARVSLERAALDVLRTSLVGIPNIEVFSGHSASNRFGPSGWELTLGQEFQFGDLRVETSSSTIVVEVESAGGVGNLIKYWPLLATGAIPKRFVILHLFRISSDGDYIAHRRLWGFLVERMREDLDPRGVPWSTGWDAQMFTYRVGDEPVDAAERLRQIVEELAP